MNVEQGNFLEDWARTYQDLCQQEGLTVRIHEPGEFERSPDTIHRFTLLIPMTVIRLAPGTEYADGQFEEAIEPEPVVCTWDEEAQTLTVEVRVEDRFYDSDDLHFLYYRRGFDEFVGQTVDLRLLGELEDQLEIDPSSVPAYENIRFLTHIASQSFRDDKKTSLSFGFSATLEELEEIFAVLPMESQLYASLPPDTNEEERWKYFISTILTASVDSLRAIYPTLYKYMYYWYAEGEDAAAYEHLRQGQPLHPPHTVWDETMEITRGRNVEDSRYYKRLARERLLASPYWIGQWALDTLQDGVLSSARLADPVFEERDDPKLLVCKMRVPVSYYHGDEIAGETYSDEEVLIYWDDVNQEVWIEMRQLFNFSLGDPSDEELQAINDSLGVEHGRFYFFRSTLAHQTDEYPYVAFGCVTNATDAVEGELDTLKNIWREMLDQLRSYRARASHLRDPEAPYGNVLP